MPDSNQNGTVRGVLRWTLHWMSSGAVRIPLAPSERTVAINKRIFSLNVSGKTSSVVVGGKTREVNK